jgi:hypothetical protein
LTTYSRDESVFGGVGRKGGRILGPYGIGIHTPDLPGSDIFSAVRKEKQLIDDIMREAFKRQDFDALFEGVQFFKFSREYAKEILGLVTTAASFMSVVGAAVAAIQAVAKIIELLGPGAGQQQALQNIGKEVHEIYGYLEGSEIAERFNQTAKLRKLLVDLENAIATAAGSASPEAIRDVADMTKSLDDAFGLYLSVENGNVPFSSQLYERGMHSPQLWTKLSGTPYLKYSSGANTPRLTGLGTFIWDPGHYADMLAAAIRLRVLAAVTLEPLYRSTGHTRPAIASLAPQLKDFIDKWDNSFVVADPASSVLADGTLAIYNTAGFFPPGILIGAICPVTGISTLRLYENFTQLEITRHSFGASSGGPDRYKAADPQAALDAAFAEHWRLVAQVRAASGIDELRRLHQRLIRLGGPPTPTESVRFGWIRKTATERNQIASPAIIVSGQAESITLGKLAGWGTDRSFDAVRYVTGDRKTIAFRMARRAVRSHIQLGYKLLIDHQEIELVQWQAQPAPEVELTWFPSQPIERILTLRNKSLYDSIQSRGFSAAEEELYDETGDTGDGGALRVLMNPRRGDVQVSVRVEFEAKPPGEDNPFLGLAKVTIEPIDPDGQRAAFLLDIDVAETHAQSVELTQTVTGESFIEGMNLHLVPSYVVAGEDFFAAYRKAYAAMLRAEAAAELEASQQGVSLDDVPTEVDPGPKFLTVVEAARIEHAVAVKARIEQSPELSLRMSRYRAPVLG